MEKSKNSVVLAGLLPQGWQQQIKMCICAIDTHEMKVSKHHLQTEDITKYQTESFDHENNDFRKIRNLRQIVVMFTKQEGGKGGYSFGKNESNCCKKDGNWTVRYRVELQRAASMRIMNCYGLCDEFLLHKNKHKTEGDDNALLTRRWHLAQKSKWPKNTEKRTTNAEFQRNEPHQIAKVRQTYSTETGSTRVGLAYRDDA